MNKKTLIALGAVAVVLAGLALFQNRSQQPASILEQVRLEPLVPAGLAEGEVVRVELYKGALPAERVVLARSTPGEEEWRVATHFDAPVDPQRIREFLANALGLRGEYRTTAQTDGDLEPYDLTEEQAFHVIGYGSADDTPLFHILVGKSPSFRTVFVRQADNRVVYVEEIDLKRDAGIQQPFEEVRDASINAPKPDHWIQKEILAAEDVERIEMTTPGRTVAFERHEAPAAETGEDTGEAEPTAPEFEWQVASGGPGGPLKSVGMESLARRFGNLRGETIVDPANAAAYGLEPPTHRLELTRAGSDAPIVIDAGRPEPTGPGYIRLAGSPHIFEVQSFTFDGIFPRASQLFDLPEVDLAVGAVREVRTHGPEGPVHLVRGEDEEWAVAEPSAPLPVQQTTVDELGRAAAVWKPVDYVNTDAAPTGLDEPRKTVTAITADGRAIETRIGNESPEGGVFVSFDGAPMTLRMSQTDLNRLFPSRSDLYQLALLTLHPDSVQGVSVERATDAFSLARTDEGAWTLAHGDDSAPADDAAVNDMLNRASGLQAREILFDLAEAPGEAEAVVRIERTDADDAVIRFGPAEDGYRWATLDGLAGVYRVPAADASFLLPESSVFRTAATEADDDAS